MPTRRDTHRHCSARFLSPPTLMLVMGLLLAGCDKIQIPEMGQPAAPAPVAAPVTPTPVATPMPTVLAKPDTKQLVAAFLEKAKTQGLKDQDLIDLSNAEGTDGFDQVQELRLGGEITDAGVSRLGKFPKLATLDLSNSKVSSVGLEVVKNLPSLQVLRLSQTAADDRVMPIIAQNPGIKELYLSNTATTDFGLNELEKLDELELIDISNTSITGAGFQRFKGHKHLRAVIAQRSGLQNDALKFLISSPIEVLELDMSAVNDMGMTHVGKMKKLKRLSMGFSNITDFGIKKLGVMKDLEYVNVRNDAGISNLLFQKLVQCKNLKYVCSTGTGISATDCAKLKKLFPDCEIAH